MAPAAGRPIPPPERPPRRAGVALGYFISTLAGYLVSALLFLEIGVPIPSDDLPTRILRALQVGVAFGGPPAVGQWIVLRAFARRTLRRSGTSHTLAARRLVRETALWIMATLAGTMASFLGLALVVPVADTATLGMAALAVLAGTPLGLCPPVLQWLALFRRVQNGVSWMLWTWIGMVIGAVWLIVTMDSLVHAAFPDGLAFAALFALPLGGFQALALYRMLPFWRAHLLESASRAPESAE